MTMELKSSWWRIVKSRSNCHGLQLEKIRLAFRKKAFHQGATGLLSHPESWWNLSLEDRAGPSCG